MAGTEPESKHCDQNNENELPTAVALSSQWIDLPGDVTANILHRLGVVEILESAQKVCTTWRGVCLDPAMWRVIHITDHDESYGRITAMYRRAVDLSQGQLVDLTIQNHCNDDFLHYIVDRSSDLKRLTLHGCRDLTEKGMVEALKKLSHLEELHLIIKYSVEAADIIDIGTSCPVLKSFTFNKYGVGYPGSKVYTLVPSSMSNGYALAIAKSMPNLCHLRLITVLSIDEEGLEAILDGCPNLESLDLGRCFVLDLCGALAKRCEQIKHLPSDSVSFIEYVRATKYYNTDDDYEQLARAFILS